MFRYIYGALLIIAAGHLYHGGHYIESSLFAIVAVYVLGTTLKKEMGL